MSTYTPLTHNEVDTEKKIIEILNEAYSRNDLGEKWAVSELLSLVSLSLLSQKKQIEERLPKRKCTIGDCQTCIESISEAEQWNACLAAVKEILSAEIKK